VTYGLTDRRTDTSTMAKTREALHAVARKKYQQFAVDVLLSVMVTRHVAAIIVLRCVSKMTHA